MKPKQHLEFVKVDLATGWQRPEGYPPGFYQKILASDLDEREKTGSRTRLLKIEPGAFSTEPGMRIRARLAPLPFIRQQRAADLTTSAA